ncbi:hypothetical protein [Frankia sp. AgB32]|uniref:hypothetical protein n=1 Tax=Frankia sp. AgB32 TaxID=631119 RepID=UPI00200E8FB5|nr:hypothetical protein [Frankia sp. AgB32]MCK9894327.1 hypothetical protein [Frankia sp. AgB32]
MERGRPTSAVDMVDDADDRDDDLVDSRGYGGRADRATAAGDADSMSFLRRLGVALVVLAVALGVGVGAGVVWEKIRPSGHTATSGGAATPSAPASPTVAATGGTAAGGAQSAATPAAGQVAVPADWVASTDAVQKATFSHPPVWKQRRDNTGIFYGEPGTASDFGPTMIGVARVAGSDANAALAKVQAGEFAGVSGLTKNPISATTDSSGQPTQELTGSYTREGQPVSYAMRTVSVSGAVYVLIVRGATSAAASINSLMGALRTSFSPAA